MVGTGSDSFPCDTFVLYSFTGGFSRDCETMNVCGPGERRDKLARLLPYEIIICCWHVSTCRGVIGTYLSTYSHASIRNEPRLRSAGQMPPIATVLSRRRTCQRGSLRLPASLG